MSDYSLPKHVYFCCRGDAVVFLDLENDRYSMIEGSFGREFRRLFLINSPEQANATGQAHDGTVRQAMIADLVNSGVLLASPSIGKPIVPTETDPPLAQIARPANDPKIRAIDLWAFIVACTKATLQLRFRTLQKTVSAVERRKARLGPSHPLNWQDAQLFVARFNKLRSLFPADYLCLFDSLALIEFLARHNIFPSWIFAVRPEFWAAHCWVQAGEVVFNEELDEAEDYVPIMTI